MTRRDPSIRKVRDYAMNSLGLQSYLRRPGDGRTRPQIQATDLVWAQLSSQILQRTSFHDVERLVRSGVARELTLNRVFSEDSLAYFNERLDPQPTRAALAATAKRAKRNKVFRGQTRIGLAFMARAPAIAIPSPRSATFADPTATTRATCSGTSTSS